MVFLIVVWQLVPRSVMPSVVCLEAGEVVHRPQRLQPSSNSNLQMPTLSLWTPLSTEMPNRPTITALRMGHVPVISRVSQTA